MNIAWDFLLVSHLCPLKKFLNLFFYLATRSFQCLISNSKIFSVSPFELRSSGLEVV